ncbi:FecR family protein [Spirosoma flavum]|uniref:FecR family protein n=1 Tax=Spirosoma flavum TaxID=2048557 RepID=A0ABW6AMV6_9BACT
MSQKSYSVYSAEELALDDLFVRWVKYPNDEEVASYWQIWLVNHPHQEETVEIACELVRTGSHPALPNLSSDEISTVWGRIRESLQTMEDVRPLQADVRAVVGWWYFIRTVLATLGVVLLIGWALWMQYGPNQSVWSISTYADQTRQIRLPDNSSMTLYPNSTVRYARRWNDETPRAVWLKGGADFSITHRNDTSSARLFRVHTAGLTIEAVGTTFQVRQRLKGTCVALTSGQVNLLLKHQNPIHLKPGDSIEVATGSAKSLP